MMNGWMLAGMGLWGLVMIVVVIALAVGAVLGGIWLVRRLRSGDTDTATPPVAVEDAAAQQLRRRYAAGEIDDEEYERRLSALTHWR